MLVFRVTLVQLKIENLNLGFLLSFNYLASYDRYKE